MKGVCLRSCIDSWEGQPDVHALMFSGGLILLQLLRYRGGPEGAQKTCPTFPFCQASEWAYRMNPLNFTRDHGLETYMRSYTVAYAIPTKARHGQTLNSGHYTSQRTGPSFWCKRSVISDDNICCGVPLSCRECLSHWTGQN